MRRLPRLIATDLDGTLLAPDSWVSTRTAAALRRVDDAGIVVAAVTGRSHHTAAERLAAVGTIRHAVCSNGATRYDVAHDVVVAQWGFEAATVAGIVDGVGRGLPGAGFGFELATGFSYDEVFLGHLPQLRRAGHRPGLVPTAFDGGNVLKVMVSHPRWAADELLRRAVPLMPAEVSASSSGAPFIEVTAPGVDKAFGLAALCSELGIAADEVLAFGDNLNDLPMLGWAGRSVAMGNAHPAVATATTDRTGTNAADGVATYLDALVG